jgi:hypothetical protein
VQSFYKKNHSNGNGAHSNCCQKSPESKSYKIGYKEEGRRRMNNNEE